jgi:hypothetical protein
VRVNNHKAINANEITILQMLVVNLYPIKNANGLLWYAFDYLRQAPVGITVLCREKHSSLIKLHVPNATIVVCDLKKTLYLIIKCWISKGRLVTFTPHPIPLFRNQVVIVHDDFPFMGPRGQLKRLLFKFAAISSCCKVGYINKSNAKKFIDSVGISGALSFYIPNQTPASLEVTPPVVSHAVPIAVLGLFGTDSPKKQYHQLLESALKQRKLQSYIFLIYGTENNYTRSLRAKYSKANIEVVESSVVPMQAFLERINIALSCSIGEGFGRPLALALTMGIPTFLLDCAIFREFFDGAAIFYTDIDQLWGKLSMSYPDGNKANWCRTRMEIQEAAKTGANILWRLS